MTKLEKIEKMLGAATGMADGVLAALRKEQPQIAKLLDAHPEVVKEWRASYTRFAVSCFESMSESAVDASIAFFSSPAGIEYKAASVSALPKAGSFMQKSIQDLMFKLVALEKKL